MKRLLTLLAVAASVGFALPAQAALIYATGTLSGLAESPVNLSPGTGVVFVEMDTDLDTLRVQATFSGLLTITSAGAPSGTTAAHIHCCTATPFTGLAGVATATPSFPGFPLGVTSGSFDQTYDLRLASSYNAAFITAWGGISGAEDALFKGLAAGATYFNIHTNAFPGGEIRSFLTPTLIVQNVPEPATSALALVGLVLAGAAATRRAVR